MGISRIIALLFSLLVAIDVHECAHAWMANELGDPTARYHGRLSLNPLVHLDPIGTVMMLMSIFYGFGIGWGKPVPVNPLYLRKGPRVGMGMVAAAGPLSNLLLAAVAAIPIRLSLPLLGLLRVLLLTMVSVNIGLVIFNLIPVFPLDGYSVLRGILGTIRAAWAYQWSDILDRMRAQGPMLLFLLIIVTGMLGVDILGFIIRPLYRLFTGS